MNQQLPNIIVNGRTYKPAIDATETAQYLLKNFDDESFQLSELVPDLEGQAVQTVFKFDENGYVLTFSGHKDEFSLIMGPILTLDIIKEGFIALSANALNDRLQNEGVQYWLSGREWFHSMEPQLVFDK